MTQPTYDQLVQAYVALRDNKKRMKERHSEELAPLNTKMALVESALMSQLNNSGAESVRTEHGTAYKITRTSVKVDNWDVTLPWVLDNQLEHMLERRLAKSSVEEYVEATGETPPGVSITRDLAIGVRRK